MQPDASQGESTGKLSRQSDRIRVILLEDDDDYRDLIGSMLRDSGYEVTAYPSPISLMEHLSAAAGSEASADILLTDNRMPGMTGIEFLERVMAGEYVFQVANRAVMSGSFSEEEEQRALNLGCSIFRKPFDGEKLIQWLDECESRIDTSRW